MTRRSASLVGPIPLCGSRMRGCSAELLRSVLLRLMSCDGPAILVSSHNVHSLALFQRNASMRSFYARCKLIYIDGFPLIAAGRLTGWPLLPKHRTTAVDWLPQLLSDMGSRSFRWFHIGGAPGTAEAGIRRMVELGLLAHCPAHQVRDGYFDIAPGSADSARLFSEIASFKPHLVTVGLGMPRQETWLLTALPHLRTRVVLVTGATLDCYGGAQPFIPRRLAGLGFEGVIRLLRSPRRLAHRYLVEPWTLLEPILSDLRQRLRH
jgi:N-acetylglucosaminyldiphosphoundecaprenol N-acetyl-beta-D-mannosaminyltransferase